MATNPLPEITTEFARLFRRMQPGKPSTTEPRRLALVCGLIASLFLVGCVSTDVAGTRIQAFSEATSLVANNTKAAFEATELRYREVQVRRAVVSYDRKGFDPAAFQPLFSEHSRKVRNDVLDAFALYSQNLATMMGGGQVDAMDQTTKNFGAKLGDLNTSISNTKIFSGKRILNDGELRIVTTAVGTLGDWFIRGKREKGVRETIVAMDPHVAAISGVMAGDLKTLRTSVSNDFKVILMSQDQFILHNQDKMDPLTKRAEIRDLAKLVGDARDQDAVFAAMEWSILQWRATHAKLVEAFTKNATEIDSLIKQLISEGQRVKKYYDSLEKK